MWPIIIEKGNTELMNGALWFCWVPGATAIVSARTPVRRISRRCRSIKAGAEREMQVMRHHLRVLRDCFHLAGAEGSRVNPNILDQEWALKCSGRRQQLHIWGLPLGHEAVIASNASRSAELVGGGGGGHSVARHGAPGPLAEGLSTLRYIASAESCPPPPPPPFPLAWKPEGTLKMATDRTDPHGRWELGVSQCCCARTADAHAER